jgi:hypothetical protein
LNWKYGEAIFGFRDQYLSILPGKPADNDLTKGWTVYIVLVIVEDTATKYVRDSALDVGHCMELTKVEQMPWPEGLMTLDIMGSAIAKALPRVKLHRALQLTCSKRFAKMYERRSKAISDDVSRLQAVCRSTCTEGFWNGVLQSFSAWLQDQSIALSAATFDAATKHVAKATDESIGMELFDIDDREAMKSRGKERRCKCQVIRTCVESLSGSFGTYEPRILHSSAGLFRDLQAAIEEHQKLTYVPFDEAPLEPDGTMSNTPDLLSLATKKDAGEPVVVVKAENL